MILGSHLSISGGLHNALESAAGYGFDCVAMFLRNQQQWQARPLDDDTVRRFRATRRRLGIGPVVAHASYLINLSGNDEVRPKSIDAMIDDVSRCSRLGVEFLVMHPGTHENVDQGISRIAEGLEVIFDRADAGRTKVLLETTAGQGRCVGHRFEHLAEIRRRCRRRGRLGVCLDTAHVFAAGYDLRTPRAWAKTLDEFDRVIGLKHLRAVHCNDSKKALGTRVDRHAHIGRGEIGAKAFGHIVRDPALADVPLILETPKGVDPDTNRDWDEINADILRGFATAAGARRRQTRGS